MSHRNSKKSNRIGQSIQKHRAQRNSPYEAEAREAMDREYRSKLPNHPIPQRATGIPAGVGSDSPSELSTQHSISPPLSVLCGPSVLSPSASPSELSNLKSEITPSSESPSQLSNLNSASDSTSPSDLASARTYIATKPATKAMHKLQHLLDTHEINFKNPDDVAQLSALMVVYAQLQNSAAVERISESLDQVGAGYKREPLTRELTKVLSIQDRALARAQREKAAKEREQRRIEREAKRDQAQAAKQARDERLFNQREDHLARKEKMVKDQLDIELNKRANLSRESVNKHTKSQGAAKQATGIPIEGATGGEDRPECTKVPSSSPSTSTSQM